MAGRSADGIDSSCGRLPDEIRNKLSDVVRTFREERRLTQEDLAERSLVSVETVRRLETGSITPTLETLCKICDALQISLRTLFSAFGSREALPTRIDELYDALARCDEEQLRRVTRVIRAVVAEDP